MAWNGVLCRHSVVICNDNERLLFEFCSDNQLTITNSIFRQKIRMKTTRMHRWFICIFLTMCLGEKRDLKDVLSTRVMPRTERCTDHLMSSKFKLQFQPTPKKK